jgi:hypothetical protein
MINRPSTNTKESNRIVASHPHIESLSKDKLDKANGLFVCENSKLGENKTEEVMFVKEKYPVFEKWPLILRTFVTERNSVFVTITVLEIPPEEEKLIELENKLENEKTCVRRCKFVREKGSESPLLLLFENLFVITKNSVFTNLTVRYKEKDAENFLDS